MLALTSTPTKLIHAFSHNIRTSGDVKYLTGDSVYFKQDGQQVLVKNGSRFIRKHPCRLQLINHNNENISHNFIQPSSQDTSLTQHQFTNPTNPTPILELTYESDTDDDSDNSCTNNFSNTPSNEQTTLSEKPPVGNIIPETQQPRQIKPNCHIKYKTHNNSEWGNTKVLCRAGKATRSYSNCWNVKTSNDQQIFIGLSKVEEYQILKETPNELTSNCENNLTRSLSNLSINEENDNETQVHETLILTNKIQQLEANLKELTQWNKEQVYDEINDNGQECIS